MIDIPSETTLVIEPDDVGDLWNALLLYGIPPSEVSDAGAALNGGGVHLIQLAVPHGDQSVEFWVPLCFYAGAANKSEVRLRDVVVKSDLPLIQTDQKDWVTCQDCKEWINA